MNRTRRFEIDVDWYCCDCSSQGAAKENTHAGYKNAQSYARSHAAKTGHSVIMNKTFQYDGNPK